MDPDSGIETFEFYSTDVDERGMNLLRRTVEQEVITILDHARDERKALLKMYDS